MFGDMVSTGVTVSLPLFGALRQDPIIAGKVATASQMRVEQEGARRDLVAQLEAGLADHVLHHEQWLRAQAVLLPWRRSALTLRRQAMAPDAPA
jgi:cobalt-zinc-cadmium efflux system outer membrane protein